MARGVIKWVPECTCTRIIVLVCTIMAGQTMRCGVGEAVSHHRLPVAVGAVSGKRVGRDQVSCGMFAQICKDVSEISPSMQGRDT